MKTFTLEELANYTESQLVGDPKHTITYFADLESAGTHDVSFFSKATFDRRTQSQSLEATQAGAIFIQPGNPLTDGKNFLLTPSPTLAFQKAVIALYQDSQDRSGFEGIHPTAVVHSSSKISSTVTIGPHAVIDKGATIGSGTTIGPGCSIGPNATIGQNCTLHANVTIRERCVLQNRIVIQPGAVIGSCGFGYDTDKRGCHTHLKQLGIVVIEDDVDIGANTTIDRARFKETRIKRGTKIDNLVQIGHGVTVGEDNIIVSQTGIAGSTKTGNHVILGGQVAVNAHIELADGVVVTSRSGVSKSLTKPGTYGGVPVMELKEYNRNAVYLRTIEKSIKRIEALEKRLSELES